MSKIKNKSVLTAHQPSITEWFAAIGEKSESEAFRKEDNHKTVRLETLYQTIGLPYERPEAWPAEDLTNLTPAFQKLLNDRGHELCAIRLVPKKMGLPKLRNRGLSIRQCYQTWYLKQKINPKNYIAYVCPHSGILLWSSIFVINKDVIFGEIIQGLHNQVTHGDTEHTLYQFRFDFRNWRWSQQNAQASRQIIKFLAILHVRSGETRKHLIRSLGATFSHNYIQGYFEANVWPDHHPYFIDYNRVLPRYLSPPPSLPEKRSQKTNILLTGIGVSKGNATGIAKIVPPSRVHSVQFSPGSILVCDNTDVRYLPLVKKAGAIVTDRGSILCHAAIVSRELNIPCIVNTKRATAIIKNGDPITVDATKGIITITSS